MSSVLKITIITLVCRPWTHYRRLLTTWIFLSISIVSLSLLDQPEISKDSSKVYADEGTTATLTCILDANPYPSTVIWLGCNGTKLKSHQENIVLQAPYQNIVRSTLYFTTIIRKSMFCNYTCTATNSEGSDSHALFLTGNSEYNNTG